MNIDVDGISFAFPKDWLVCKYDDSAFYLGTFIKVHSGLKAVDLVAIEPVASDAVVHFIEVKDYRHPKATGKPPSALAEDVARKVTGTIAGLWAGSRMAMDPHERAISESFASSIELNITLHCEDRAVPIVDPSELAIKLRKRLQPIATRVVVGRAGKPGTAWTASP